MCDTVGFPRTFFGKNSDREPGEVQLFQYVTIDDVPPTGIRERAIKKRYIENELPVLERVLREEGLNAENTCGALISRPDWLWGAEMGVNDHGVAIGNEGVFSRRSEKDSVLLGMDILRLALHRSTSAEEAVSVITDLIQRYGEGGDGGFRHSIFYSNGFIVQDASDLWVVETSRRDVRSKRADGPRGISNVYSGDTGWDESSKNGRTEVGRFKKRDEKRLFALAGRGSRRNRLKEPWLTGDRPVDTVLDLFLLLRRHRDGTAEGEYDPPKRGMGSICLHTGTLIKSETTASMVVDWTPQRGDVVDGSPSRENSPGGTAGNAAVRAERRPVVWYTGSSWPCVSLYKPLLLGRENGDVDLLRDLNVARDIYRARLEFNLRQERRHSRFHREVAPFRDELEVSFLGEVTELNTGLPGDRFAGVYRNFQDRITTAEREYMKKFTRV